MKAFTVVPKISHCKWLPLLATITQLAVIGFGAMGYLITSAAYVLAGCGQFCVLCWIVQFLCSKYYRVYISADTVTVQGIFNQTKVYDRNAIRWKILRIPWYRSYGILLYSAERNRIAVIKPHWENALETVRFPHLGKLSPIEIDYLDFLKRNGRLPPNVNRIKQK